MRPFTPPSSPAPESGSALSSVSPDADAVALAEVSDEPTAWSSTAPPASKLRNVIAETSWSAYVRAKATPIAVSPVEAVSPLAVVWAEAVSAALKETAPPEVSAGPAPMAAEVFTLLIVMAMAGAKATSPLAPVFASVVTALEAVAVIDRSAAPTSAAPFAISAVVDSFTTASAKEAPIPRSAPTPPSPSGHASTCEAESDAALIVTSLLVSVVVEAGESSALTSLE